VIGSQGEVEHRQAKRRFPWSGKKKDHTIKSITNQDAIERFIRKVDTARRSLEEHLEPRRTRNSPSEHCFVAQTSRKADNLTAWLDRRRNDIAFTASFTLLGFNLLTKNLGFSPPSQRAPTSSHLWSGL